MLLRRSEKGLNRSRIGQCCILAHLQRSLRAETVGPRRVGHSRLVQPVANRRRPFTSWNQANCLAGSARKTRPDNLKTISTVGYPITARWPAESRAVRASGQGFGANPIAKSL